MGLTRRGFSDILSSLVQYLYLPKPKRINLMLAQQEVTLHVKFPRSILFDYGLTEQEASKEMMRAFVLSLYRRDKISSGKAARLLGMHRLDFIRLLADEGIPYLDYTSEELEADTQALKEWEKK
jgi:predicted HTH domain antitoxin